MRIERNIMASVPDPFQIQALAETPDVRADKVARGKALIADPNYPSKEQMRKIAGLLAEKMMERNSSSRVTASPSARSARDMVASDAAH